MSADDPRTAPWGHSRAAHTVHGWCAHCPGYSAMDEAAAWRVHENERRRRAQEALEAAEQAAADSPYSAIQMLAADPAVCPACGHLALTVVTVYAQLHEGGRARAGGWALCNACGATPHPTLDAPQPEGADRD